MRIKALTLFKRGQGEYIQSHYVIAAWHWRKSITWSWLLWWTPPWRVGHTVKLRHRIYGSFFFSTQKPMWKNEEDYGF